MAGPFPAKDYYDRTSVMMKEHEQQGLELSDERTIEGIKVRLYLSGSAKSAIEKGAFMVPDLQYSQEKLNSFIFETFESSLAYFRVLDPAEEIKELNLVLLDNGGDKGTISETGGLSRLIELHLVRWHKYLLKKSKHLVAVSSVHELAHVINYMYSPKETKFHREMAAVLLECLHLIQLYGIETFSKSYQRNFTTKMDDLGPLDSVSYTNMNVIRNIAFLLMKNLYNGTYKGPAEPKKVTEEFAMNYLKNPNDDEQGFNLSLQELGITDSEGNALTLQKLREDTKAFLTPVN